MWASHMPAYAINWLSPDAAGESPTLQRQDGASTQPACALSWLLLSLVPCQVTPPPISTCSPCPTYAPHHRTRLRANSAKAEIPFITSAVRSPFRNVFFHVNPVPKRGGVGCADPETVLRMLLPPVYHRTLHLARGQAVTALWQQAL